MPNENGTWVMYGVEWDDPECLHTVDEAIEYINEVGFLPLFKNEIPGFSLEERTVPEYWWSGNKTLDPWEWREIIASRGDIAYGRFFDKKAGFISKEWFPYFANYRRDGYDFDALWDDEKASIRQKKIMDVLETCDEIYSNDLKQKAGFGKEGEKGFDGVITELQMMTYLVIRDFRQRKNKKGEAYGWPIAIFTKPENLYGREHVTSLYTEDPADSGKAIAKHLIEIHPIITADQIKKILGGSAGVAPKTIKKKKTVYPKNVFEKLGIEGEPTKDQIIGLEFAIGFLKEREQELIHYYYEEGLSYTEISKKWSISSSRASTTGRHALRSLRRKHIFPWIKDGYQATLDARNAKVKVIADELIAKGEDELAKMLYESPVRFKNFKLSESQPLVKAGITNLGQLVVLARTENWFESIHGIGYAAATHIEKELYLAGLIDKAHKYPLPYNF